MLPLPVCADDPGVHVRLMTGERGQAYMGGLQACGAGVHSKRICLLPIPLVTSCSLELRSLHYRRPATQAKSQPKIAASQGRAMHISGFVISQYICKLAFVARGHLYECRTRR
jgi:hypothetical protein